MTSLVDELQASQNLIVFIDFNLEGFKQARKWQNFICILNNQERGTRKNNWLHLHIVSYKQ